MACGHRAVVLRPHNQDPRAVAAHSFGPTRTLSNEVSLCGCSSSGDWLRLGQPRRLTQGTELLAVASQGRQRKKVRMGVRIGALTMGSAILVACSGTIHPESEARRVGNHQTMTTATQIDCGTHVLKLLEVLPMKAASCLATGANAGQLVHLRVQGQVPGRGVSKIFRVDLG